MGNNIVKSLKGYNAFSKVILKGKRIKIKELTSYFIYNDNNVSFLKSSDPNIIYIGVTNSKKINKKAVLRNRIKRLLRVAVRQVIMKDTEKYKIIKYAVFIFNKKIPYCNFITLKDIVPLVENSIDNAIEYKLKKKTH